MGNNVGRKSPPERSFPELARWLKEAPPETQVDARTIGALLEHVSDEPTLTVVDPHQSKMGLARASLDGAGGAEVGCEGGL